MAFQSSHPSRSRTVGGRTGTETLEAVLAASAILLAANLYLFRQMLGPTTVELSAYSCLIATIAASLLVFRLRLWRYRYQPSPAETNH
jgi:hypothetical protein